MSQKEPPIGAASLPVPKLDVLKEVPPSESNQLNRSEKKRFGSLHKKKSKVKMEPENTKGEEDDDFGDFDLFKPKEDLSQFRPGGSEYRSAEAGQMKKAMATPSSKNTMTPGGKTPRKKRMMPTPSKENCKQQ